MLAIVCAGTAGAGAEVGLTKQGFECAVKSFFVEGLSAQSIFCFCGAEGSPAAWANGDANIFDDVIFAFKPDGAIQNRQAPRPADA